MQLVLTDVTDIKQKCLILSTFHPNNILRQYKRNESVPCNEYKGSVAWKCVHVSKAIYNPDITFYKQATYFVPKSA